MAILGMLHRDGGDRELAEKWLTQAVEAGCVNVSCDLGSLLLERAEREESETEPLRKQAEIHYRNCIDDGCFTAMRKLATMLETRAPEEAAEWRTRADEAEAAASDRQP